MHALQPGMKFSPPRTLSAYTTFRLGGPCAEFCTASSPEEIQQVIRTWNARGMPWRVMGGGSNLLVADAGIPEAVLRILQEPGNISLTAGEIAIPAALPLDAVAHAAASQGLDGLGFAHGIPGTLGGAVAGNAGAFGQQIGDLTTRVGIITAQGEQAELSREELSFDYRQSILATMPCAIHTVWLRLTAADADALLAKRAEILAERKRKHPDWHTQRTAGSFFKNLPPTHSGGRRQAAGCLLDEVGAKNARHGGAYVFPAHANILMAEEQATAADVAALARTLQRHVAERFGIQLVPEVRFWGFPHPPA